MKDYLIRLAINYSHSYPWGKEKDKGTLLLSKEEIDNILKEEELSSIEKRREIGWRIQKIMYLKAVHAKDIEDLKEKISKEFKDLNYKIKTLPMDLIDETLKRKKLLFQQELELYKKFIAGKFTQQDYNTKSVCVQTWLTDILAIYYITSDNKENVAKDVVLNFIEFNIESRFNKENYRRKTISDYLAHSGFNTKEVIQLYRNLFLKEHNDSVILLKNAIPFKKGSKAEAKEAKLDSFLDEISQLLGTEEEGSKLKEKINKGETKDQLKEETKEQLREIVETKEQLKETVKIQEQLHETVKIEDKSNELELIAKQESNVLDIVIDNLNKTVEALGYNMIEKSEYEKLTSKYEPLVNVKEKEKQILENKMQDFLKKLVAPEEGAVLSELYSLYTSFEKTDKANIGATLTNFFNKLMLMGLEVKEDGTKEGDKVIFHSSELLKTYRVLRAVNAEGNIEGTIKYVGWDYQGNTLMQPIVRVSNK